jgi:hypothetical protein
VSTAASSELTTVEQRRCGELEAVIDRGMQTFAEVGAALAEIRDSRLYRDGHATFEDYARARWGMDRTYAHRHIDAARVVAMLPNGNIPLHESHARELGKLLSKGDPEELVAEVWARVSEGGAAKVTAKAIQRERSAIATARNADRLERSPIAPYTGNAGTWLPLEALWPSEASGLERAAKECERRADKLPDTLPRLQDAHEVEEAINAAAEALRHHAAKLRSTVATASRKPRPIGAAGPEHQRELIAANRRQKVAAGYCAELGCWTRLEPGETRCAPDDCWGWPAAEQREADTRRTAA